MTANAFDEDRQACLLAGMNDFVPKPVDVDILFGAVLRWLRQRRMASNGAHMRGKEHQFG